MHRQIKKNYTNMKTTILGNLIKETERAVLVSTLVSWGNGSAIRKEIWMPKSAMQVIRTDSEHSHIQLEYWFVRNVEEKNSFHGYPMEFVNCYTEE